MRTEPKAPVGAGAARDEPHAPDLPGANENADAFCVGVFLSGLANAGYQNAGSTAPWYFFSMKAFTSGLVSALASFWMASLFLLSGRATRKFT